MEDGVKECAEKIMCMYMSRHRNIGQNHDKGHTKNIKSENIQIFWMDKSINKNYSHEETMSNFKSVNDCYRYFILLFFFNFCVLSKKSEN
jgi:hypothetical protein